MEILSHVPTTEYLVSLVGQEINMNYAPAMFPSKFNINGLTQFLAVVNLWQF